MSSKEGGEHDQDHIDWKRSIATKKMTKKNTLNFVRYEISHKFESISDDTWWVSTNGPGRKGQPYAKAMVRYAIYFNRSFTIAKYGMLLGLSTPQHNMEVAKD
mmetsp:Transcript_62457/g.69855  ORF Transcript_62457/g.69855 Transcript_62457/m.69855 type:complete len:103 (-) Transcript_62457:446-754(-)